MKLSYTAIGCIRSSLPIGLRNLLSLLVLRLDELLLIGILGHHMALDVLL